MVVNCGELSCHRSPKQPLRSITFSQLIASEWLHPTDCIQPTTRIYNSYTSSLAAALLLARTTGVINTVRGYHATSCSLVWFAVYRMGRQTQLWSGPMRELVALALWLQNLCFPIGRDPNQIQVREVGSPTPNQPIRHIYPTDFYFLYFVTLYFATLYFWWQTVGGCQLAVNKPTSINPIRHIYHCKLHCNWSVINAAFVSLTNCQSATLSFGHQGPAFLFVGFSNMYICECECKYVHYIYQIH